MGREPGIDLVIEFLIVLTPAPEGGLAPDEQLDLHGCSPLAVTLDSRSPPPRQLDPMRQEK